MTCTTHHNACECREAAHAAEIERLRALVSDMLEDVGYTSEVFGGDLPGRIDAAIAAWDGRRQCAECSRKESVIQKYKRGHVRRDAMADQIERLIKDRDHWKSMAIKGSSTQAKTLNNYRQRAIRAEASLEKANAALTQKEPTK